MPVKKPLGITKQKLLSCESKEKKQNDSEETKNRLKKGNNKLTLKMSFFKRVLTTDIHIFRVLPFVL